MTFVCITRSLTNGHLCVLVTPTPVSSKNDVQRSVQNLFPQQVYQKGADIIKVKQRKDSMATFWIGVGYDFSLICRQPSTGWDIASNTHYSGFDFKFQHTMFDHLQNEVHLNVQNQQLSVDIITQCSIGPAEITIIGTMPFWNLTKISHKMNTVNWTTSESELIAGGKGCGEGG